MTTTAIITFFASLGDKDWLFLNIASAFRDIKVERASGGGFRLSADEKAEGEDEGRRGRQDPEGAIGGRIRRE